MPRQPATDPSAPWPDEVARGLAKRLWPALESYVNGPEPTRADALDLWHWLRKALDRITRGRPPLPGVQARIPLVIVCRRDGTTWGVSTHARNRDRQPRAEQLRRMEREWNFTVLALWHPAVRRRVQCCAACGRFELLNRPKAGGRRYCGPDCVAAWRRSPEGLADAAKRQQAYRRRVFPARDAERSG